MAKTAAKKTKKKRTSSRTKHGEPTVVEVAGRSIKLSNPAKVLYPATGFTKGEVLDYYARVAPALLPHFRDRAVTLVRYPDGVDGGHFYEKNCPTYRPPWMETTSAPKSDGSRVNFCVLEDEAALLWVVNLAALELHPYLHRGDDIEHPTMLVIDLDPGPDRTLKDCAKLALEVRDLLGQLRLECLAKTSGGKGLHLAVPLNSGATYTQTRAFAQALARLLQEQRPDEVTATMSKAVRKGKIFLDWSQNVSAKTTAGAYSLRAREEPSVSTPLAWEEVEALSRSRKKQPFDMSPKAVLKRVDKLGDLWGPVETLVQELPEGLPR